MIVTPRSVWGSSRSHDRPPSLERRIASPRSATLTIAHRNAIGLSWTTPCTFVSPGGRKDTVDEGTAAEADAITGVGIVSGISRVFRQTNTSATTIAKGRP